MATKVFGQQLAWPPTTNKPSKVAYYWPFVRGIHQWFTPQKTRNANNVFMSWRHRVQIRINLLRWARAKRVVRQDKNASSIVTVVRDFSVTRVMTSNLTARAGLHVRTAKPARRIPNVAAATALTPTSCQAPGNAPHSVDVKSRQASIIRPILGPCWVMYEAHLIWQPSLCGDSWYNVTETERSGWLSYSSLGTLKTSFNVPSDDQGSHPDDLYVSVMLLRLRNSVEDRVPIDEICVNNLPISCGD